MRGATSLSHCSCSSVGLEREAVKSKCMHLSNRDECPCCPSPQGHRFDPCRERALFCGFFGYPKIKVASVLVAQSVERWSYGPGDICLLSQGSRRSRVQAPPGTRHCVRVWSKEEDLRSSVYFHARVRIPPVSKFYRRFFFMRHVKQRVW